MKTDIAPRRWLLAFTLLAAAPALAAPLPAPTAASHALREVGRGHLSWLGFGIYEASLWTPDGTFDGLGREKTALALWYQRRFSTAELVEITTGEWRRLGLATPAQAERWGGEVARIWPAVRKGDNMTAVVVPGGATYFYNRDRLLGRIDDPAFGPAYLGIWLDARSAVADLRVALLGGRNGQ